MQIAPMMRPAAVILPTAQFTCILALWAFQAAPVPNKVPSDDSCSIEVRVVNSVTGAPVAQANLLLGRADDNSQRIVRANGDGQLAFRNLKPGRFWFEARGSGYIPQQFGAVGSVSSEEDRLLLSAGSGLAGSLRASISSRQRPGPNRRAPMGRVLPPHQNSPRQI